MNAAYFANYLRQEVHCPRVDPGDLVFLYPQRMSEDTRWPEKLVHQHKFETSGQSVHKEPWMQTIKTEFIIGARLWSTENCVAATREVLDYRQLEGFPGCGKVLVLITDGVDEGDWDIENLPVGPSAWSEHRLEALNTENAVVSPVGPQILDNRLDVVQVAKDSLHDHLTFIALCSVLMNEQAEPG